MFCANIFAMTQGSASVAHSCPAEMSAGPVTMEVHFDLCDEALEVVVMVLSFVGGWIVFCHIARMIRSSAMRTSAPKETERLRQSASEPAMSLASEEIGRSYAHQGSPDVAVGMWLAVPVSDRNPRQSVIYAAAVEACVSCSNFTLALELVRGEDFAVPCTKAGQMAVLVLARTLAQRKDITGARCCVDALRSGQCHVDLATMRSLIAACAWSADVAEARALFQDMISMNLTPDTLTYTSLVRCCCAVGDMEQAVFFFQSMRSQGLVPDTGLFDCLFEGCASRNKMGLAELLLAEMRKLSVRPSSATLATLVRLHAARGELHQALSVFEELPTLHGVEPDARAYGTLVAACIGGSRLELALAAFDRMCQAGCCPSARTYERLISSCVHHGNIEKAIAILDHAMGGGTPTSRRACIEPKVIEELLTLLGRRRQGRLAVQLLERLHKAGIEVPQRLSEMLQACQGQDLPSGVLMQRREALNRWRNFPSCHALQVAA